MHFLVKKYPKNILQDNFLFKLSCFCGQLVLFRKKRKTSSFQSRGLKIEDFILIAKMKT
jgi:hypothetical protein